MTNYTDFPDLANVYLEDSFVLGIDETPTSLSFRLEAVLTQAHPRYHQPRPGEAHCYADAVLTIADATKIEWITRSSQTYRDATGEEDLGNIDSLQRHADHYEIFGDWGHVRIFSRAAPRLTFIPEATNPAKPQGPTTT
ncbi:hypothetical protein QRX60_37640 [Amycolatopsis mongoliensis]|uniref:Uncharacterized protein n=1 Tax=Amycolatopsis mongoliensis TaxID=715475 RepID=A0A9Y2JLS1_9PSEU|nr:hypothetical protein [Amycolatopsis sp. 4-36]WIX99736.1 hypothetical protein QRX60_37640 [Amycolatopsis sp. 4-36]